VAFPVAERWTKASYAAYLRSDHWRDVKKRYRASAMPQACVVCGEARVDLHHRTYERLGHEELTDLVPLCRQHHGEAHRLRVKYRHDATATARQLAYITRLGGRPSAEMTPQHAKAMATRVREDNAYKAEQRKRRRKRRERAARVEGQS
jgi:hypothetical protein